MLMIAKACDRQRFRLRAGACWQRRRWPRRSTTRAHPTPRSRSAIPSPIPAPRRRTASSARRSKRSSRRSTTTAASTAARSTSSATTTATARPRPRRWCASWSRRTRSLFLFNTLGTPSNTTISNYLNEEKVPQLFVATGASKWGDPKGHPWTMGFQPDYQTEAVIYAKHILANVKDAEDRRADAERRLRQGLLQRLQDRPRQGRRQDRQGRDL